MHLRNIPIPKKIEKNLLSYKDALINLALPNVPDKTKKRLLVQESGGFVQELLVPVITSLGFMML